MKIIEKRSNGRKRVYTSFDPKKDPLAVSRVQKEHAESTDVNNIMAKYKKTGQITHLNSKTGVYADLTQFPDFQESLHRISEAQEAFDALPSEIRTRFGNDPQMLIDFLKKTDKESVEEAIKLGLRVKKEAPKNEVVDAINNLGAELRKSSPKKEPKE